MRATILVRKLMGLSVVTKSRCGFLVALVMLITIGVNEGVRHTGFLSRNEAYVCIFVGSTGLVFWIIGWLKELRRVEPVVRQAEPGSSAAAEDPLVFLRSPKYWGLIFALSAGILSVLAVCRPKQVVEVRARPKPVPVVTVVTNEPVVTNEVPPVVFPPLLLQGVVVNGPKSSAVINGRVVCLGEMISNVVLVAVAPDHAAVTLEGETKLLTLRR